MKKTMTKRIAFVLGIVLLIASMNAQTRVVYGKLTAYNKYPIQNIVVKTKKSKAKVKSDSLGMFAIVCMEKDKIIIKPKAFKSLTRKVDAETDTLFINLVILNTRSNRDISTGYGNISQQDLSYSVSHIEQEENEFCNYTNIFELINGRFPGVVAGGGGVFIRGATSVNLSSEALYVVDGGITINIDYIHPCNVRSIDIIKDGMSAIYGTRGSNGVVIIETKRGNN